jgi:hypothetical protein
MSKPNDHPGIQEFIKDPNLLNLFLKNIDFIRNPDLHFLIKNAYLRELLLDPNIINILNTINV